jgi:site-specific recombinase XerD
METITPTKIYQAVLNTVDSGETKRAYNRALTDFATWRLFRGMDFNRAAVQAYKAELLTSGMGAVNISQRLTAIRKLAQEAADNGELDQSIAGGIQRVKGVRREGKKLGNWLTKEQAQDLINAPDINTLKGLRDRAILAVLIGCGLRREEAASLTCAHLQQREARWVIVDLVGKRNKVRSVPMPCWTKSAIDAWVEVARITDGYVFRAVRKGSFLAGDSMTAQGIYNMVRGYLPGIACHDLRRSFAKLAHKGGAALEQIQLSLGHASIKTTEVYLGVSQNLTDAPCDRLGLSL